VTNDSKMREENVHTYTARLEREKDGRWSVELEEEPRVHTWGKTVDQALARMREAAALWFQIGEDQIELVPKPLLPKATDRTSSRRAKHDSKPAPPTGSLSNRPGKPPRP